MSKPNIQPRFARYAKQQTAEKFDELIAFIGTKAEPYSKTEKEMIFDALKLPYSYEAILVGKQELDCLPDLRLTPEGNECKVIRFYQLGEVTQDELDRLALSIAKYQPNLTAFQFLDVTQQAITDKNGEPMRANFEKMVNRLRNNEMAEITVQAIEEGKVTEDNNTQPFFEERSVNGINGIYYIKPARMDGKGNFVKESAKWTCNTLKLKGEGYNESGEAFYIFEWQHPLTRKPHTEAIPLSTFGKSAGWEIMQKYGLKMTNESYLNKLADHFHFNGEHAIKWTVSDSTGWKNGAYLLPSGEIIGQPFPPVLFKNKDDGENAYKTAGTLESWRAEIGDNLRGNAYFMLAVATALASPLLRILKAKSFGVHLYNDSSKGKTTALNIANSVWGNPEDLDQKWNQTTVAMMNNAQSRNDNFLTLDEIGQCKNFDDLEQTAYLLFNETGRGRGKKEGGNQQGQKWKITALSTGEIDLEGFLQSKGRSIQAGSLVRLLNIPMTEPTKLHQFSTAKAHADHLNEASTEHYGVLGRKWIEFIIENKQQIKNHFNHYKTLWVERIPAEADSQVQRVINHFAILETSLQLTSHLTGWSEEENREAIIKAFNSWLAGFGTRSKEESNIIDKVNGWLLQAQHSEFIEVKNGFALGVRPTKNTAGYKMTKEATGEDKEYFYIYPNVFKDVIKGKAKEVAFRALLSVEMLDKTLEHSPRQYQRKISRKLEENQPYCYVLYPLNE